MRAQHIRVLQPLTALSFNMQTDRGHEQARAGAKQIKQILQSENETFKLFFYMSPYKRSKQTYEGIAAQFSRSIVAGTQEEVQLREQDFGNFQVSCCMLTAGQAMSCHVCIKVTGRRLQERMLCTSQGMEPSRRDKYKVSRV